MLFNTRGAFSQIVGLTFFVCGSFCVFSINKAARVCTLYVERCTYIIYIITVNDLFIWALNKKCRV